MVFLGSKSRSHPTLPTAPSSTKAHLFHSAPINSSWILKFAHNSSSCSFCGENSILFSGGAPQNFRTKNFSPRRQWAFRSPITLRKTSRVCLRLRRPISTFKCVKLHLKSPKICSSSGPLRQRIESEVTAWQFEANWTSGAWELDPIPIGDRLNATKLVAHRMIKSRYFWCSLSVAPQF